MLSKPQRDHRFTHLGGRRWIWRMFPMLMVLLVGTALYAEEDPIYERCRSQTDRPGPWCYQEAVEKTGNPDQCENILRYWPKAAGVHGWCYYRLAIIQNNCSLCDRIHKADIKRTCRLDCK